MVSEFSRGSGVIGTGGMDDFLRLDAATTDMTASLVLGLPPHI